jgi:hypothetical protein
MTHDPAERPVQGQRVVVHYDPETGRYRTRPVGNAEATMEADA